MNIGSDRQKTWIIRIDAHSIYREITYQIPSNILTGSENVRRRVVSPRIIYGKARC